MADILTAMVMPDEDPVRHLGLVHTEYTLARLPNRLQRFMAGAVLSHMNPETLSDKVVEDGNDDHLPLLLHPRCHGIGPPHRIQGNRDNRLIMHPGSVGVPPHTGANSWCCPISRRIRSLSARRPRRLATGLSRYLRRRQSYTVDRGNLQQRDWAFIWGHSNLTSEEDMTLRIAEP